MNLPVLVTQLEREVMAMLLRFIAISVEVILLAAVIYVLLNGVRLTFFDLGVGPKYKQMVVLTFCVVGCLAVVFFIAHLTAFYPLIPSG